MRNGRSSVKSRVASLPGTASKATERWRVIGRAGRTHAVTAASPLHRSQRGITAKPTPDDAVNVYVRVCKGERKTKRNEIYQYLNKNEGGGGKNKKITEDWWF